MNKAWISSIDRVDSRKYVCGSSTKTGVQFYLSMGMQWSEDTSDKWKLTPKCLICEKILREIEKSTFWYE